jgi:hypothetical protein
MRHKLSWYATYNNNSIIHQYSNSNKQISFNLINKQNLKNICLTDGKKIVVSFEFTPGVYPIYRLRTLLQSNINFHRKIHILGSVIFDGLQKPISNIVFVDDDTNLIEKGCFVEGENSGYKYPIDFQKEDYTPIVWT